MYTETVQSEKKFYVELIESQNTEMKVGDTVVVRKCPKCHMGKVLTRCIHSVSNGDGFWEFEHYCDSCGEKFIPGRLWSDIFFHEPYDMLREIDSPFGKLSVNINGVSVPFQCRTRYYDLQKYVGEKPVMYREIDIDVSDLKQDDIIFCGFDDGCLEFNDSDEESILYSCEDEKWLFGFGAIDPDEDSTYYCYQLEKCSKDGVRYRIVDDPANYDRNLYYKSKIIVLYTACIDKAEYEQANTILFLALA